MRACEKGPGICPGPFRYCELPPSNRVTVIGANAPSWPGSEQLRYFDLQGKILTLKTPPIRGRDGVKQVQQLIWERV